MIAGSENGRHSRSEKPAERDRTVRQDAGVCSPDMDKSGITGIILASGFLKVKRADEAVGRDERQPGKGEGMSFSGNLREELAQIIPSRRQSRETAAATLQVNLGEISLTEKGGYLVCLSGGNPGALRKYFTLIQKNGNIKPDLFLLVQSVKPGKPGADKKGIRGGQADTEDFDNNFGKKERKSSDGHTAPAPEVKFLLAGTKGPAGEETNDSEKDLPILPRQFTELMEKAQLIGIDGRVRENNGTLPAVFVQGQAGRAYLREMFLCTGFMNDPKKRYHLEFRCFSQPQADQLREVLGEQGIHAGLTLRKKYFVVYLKDSEDIVRLLQLMGASVSLMAMENVRIYKEVRNNVNRRVNCETANIGKTVESASRQLEDIRVLRDGGILQDLPPQIREAAALREEHPGASLSELGELADPPVGRSGMNHRMRKIASLAQKIQQMQ